MLRNLNRQALDTHASKARTRCAWHPYRNLGPWAGWVLAALGTVWAQPALADQIEPLKGSPWTMWDHSPLIIGGCLLVLTVYLRGYMRRRSKGERVNPWRAVSYVSGVLMTYAVLQSPVDALSDHIFWVHRVQHVALHHWIPMLLALAAPIPELVRGLPRWARLHLLRPILRNRGVRLSWSFIQHPVVAPILFVGVIYFWLTPSNFQYATIDANVHDVMHLSMLLDGIPFWWLMLSPIPGRLSYGKRLVILWAIMLPQILAGAYITLTPRVLYPLYALLDHGWVSSYMRDQCLGGLIVWIPGSMM
ncbi:MAG: cytochrome c oxidase assembly protein, partial [Steroidobacteraceae bacterium]